MSELFRTAMAQNDYAAASLYCEQALGLMPENIQAQNDYAFSLMRQGKYDEAYKFYRNIYQSPRRYEVSERWLNCLAELCGHMGKVDEMRAYGLESLTLADRRFCQGKSWPLPLSPPRPFNATQPEKNVIAFSLYGDQPRYCETLIKNVHTAAELFPAWRCRVYLDDSVPQHVWQRLKCAGASLIDMSNKKSIYPTLWRFLVLDDPLVERFLVRDADSLLSEREQACVTEWLKLPFYFHHMRDYFTHTELLLAGMWGGCGGLLPNVEAMMCEFLVSYQDSAYFTDQNFLKFALWPTVRQSILNHDEIFGFHHAHPWPPHAPVRWNSQYFHVGSNAGFTVLAGLSARDEGEKQAVMLKVEGVSYRYTAVVRNGHWRLPVPFFLADGFRCGNVRIEVVNDTTR